MIGVTTALLNLLNELIDGPSPEAARLLNPEDPGLLRSLDRLSAEQASAVPAAGGAPIAPTWIICVTGWSC